MVRKSYGKMRGVRKKLHLRRKPVITDYLHEYTEGDEVHINIVPSSAFPHHRFHGTTGVVIEKRGGSYGVRIRDGRAAKVVYLRPEHLKPAKK